MMMIIMMMMMIVMMMIVMMMESYLPVCWKIDDEESLCIGLSVTDRKAGFLYSQSDIDDSTTDTEENAIANPAY